MPIYEYACKACGGEFEAMRKFDDAPLESCASCGQQGQVSRKLSLSAFQLKGSGWFKQGYGGSSGGGGGSGSSGSSSSESAAKPAVPS